MYYSIKSLKDAWDVVPQSLLVNSWNNLLRTFIPYAELKNSIQNGIDSTEDDLSFLQRIVSKLDAKDYTREE